MFEGVGRLINASAHAVGQYADALSTVAAAYDRASYVVAGAKSSMSAVVIERQAEIIAVQATATATGKDGSAAVAALVAAGAAEIAAIDAGAAGSVTIPAIPTMKAPGIPSGIPAPGTGAPNAGPTTTDKGWIPNPGGASKQDKVSDIDVTGAGPKDATTPPLSKGPGDGVAPGGGKGGGAPSPNGNAGSPSTTSPGGSNSPVNPSPSTPNVNGGDLSTSSPGGEGSGPKLDGPKTDSPLGADSNGLGGDHGLSPGGEGSGDKLSWGLGGGDSSSSRDGDRGTAVPLLPWQQGGPGPAGPGAGPLMSPGGPSSPVMPQSAPAPSAPSPAVPSSPASPVTTVPSGQVGPPTPVMSGGAGNVVHGQATPVTTSVADGGPAAGGGGGSTTAAGSSSVGAQQNSMRTVAAAAFAAALPEPGLITQGPDPDLVLAETVVAALVAASPAIIGLHWAASVVSTGTGQQVYVTSNEGRGWIPATVRMPRDVLSPWKSEHITVDQSRPWELVDDAGRVLVEHAAASTGVYQLKAVASTRPITSTMRAALPECRFAQVVDGDDALDLSKSSVNTVDRLDVVAPEMGQRIAEIPSAAIGLELLGMAWDANSRLVWSSPMTAPGTQVTGAAVRGQILEAMNNDRGAGASAVPDHMWQRLYDMDGLARSLCVAQQLPAGQISVGALRDDPQSVLRLATAERRVNEIIGLMHGRATRTRLRHVYFAYDQLMASETPVTV